LNENDLAEFVKLQKTKADSENSWSVNVVDVDTTTYDISVKNPNKRDDKILRKPEKILNEMKRLDDESTEILEIIRKLV
jgi:type I restriction enzyme M protein